MHGVHAWPDARGRGTRRSKRERAAGLLARSGLGSALRALRTWRGVLALTYHRIGEPSATAFEPDVFSATPETFADHLAFFTRNFDVIRPGDVSAGLDRRGRHLLITFDDGYRDNYDHAYPLLRGHGLPATFFVTTGFIGRSRVSWWDEIAWMVRRSTQDTIPPGSYLPAPLSLREPHRVQTRRELAAVYKALPGERTEGFLDFVAEASGSGRCPPSEANQLWMTWDMLRELQARDMVIGGHTVDHPVLSRLSPRDQEQQIRGSADDLRRELDAPMRFFAYPIGVPGSFLEPARACLRAVGVELAFSARAGYEATTGFDALDVRRMNVGFSDSLSLVAAIATLPQLFARD